jgi:sugar/nucleoside kinase (ribokinase family)
MKYDIITIGGTTEDLSFYTNEGVLIDNKEDVLRQKLLAFEFGAKIKIEKTIRTFGGGAANAAVGLARLGFKTGCLAAVGGDEMGKRIKRNFKKENVDVGLVKTLKNEESGYSFILVGQDNEHIAFLCRGANSRLIITEKDIKALNSSKWIFISSLPVNHQNLKSIFLAKGPRIAWNPGQNQLRSGLAKLKPFLKKTDILILNKDEAIELAISDSQNKRETNEFINDSANLLSIIKSWGPKVAVITDGKEGAQAFDGHKIFFQKAVIVKNPKNTTGVGDAFGSTLIAGLELFENNFSKALALAAKNSASVVGKIGAQTGLISQKDI